jgi:hypothetical protein
MLFANANRKAPSTETESFLFANGDSLNPNGRPQWPPSV